MIAWSLFPAGAFAAERYEAERFDVRVSLEKDGAVRVTETVSFRFEGGTCAKACGKRGGGIAR